ncbi:DUF2752 domain-containing protein [Hyalangium versicolor]|uniref:DUF2752 domain-containing protein n=1 Tax=Hyalangium versicolor TaxID=2861190 RepID=UPI001CCB7385|nr:DUF2752 domain-containing protein [Hyalangium versicolor]
MDQRPNVLARSFQRLSSPVLAQVLERRATGMIIGVSALAHLGLMRWALPTWQCPLMQALGIPCPGCGLSRAMASLLHGDWAAALAQHAFAPLVLASLALIFGMALLPESIRQRGVAGVARFERRTGLVALLLLALVAYWLVRMLVFRSAFIHTTIG